MRHAGVDSDEGAEGRVGRSEIAALGAVVGAPAQVAGGVIRRISPDP